MRSLCISRIVISRSSLLTRSRSPVCGFVTSRVSLAIGELTTRGWLSTHACSSSFTASVISEWPWRSLTHAQESSVSPPMSSARLTVASLMRFFPVERGRPVALARALRGGTLTLSADGACATRTAWTKLRRSSVARPRFGAAFACAIDSALCCWAKSAVAVVSFLE